MTPEEQIAALQQQVAELQTIIDGEPARVAALNAAIDQRAEYASGLESQLSVALTERDTARAEVSGAESRAAAAEAELLLWKPPAGAEIPVAEFKKRLAPAYLALASKPPELQGKWDRIMNGLLGSFTTITLTDPLAGAMVYTAVADGLLSSAQAAAVLAHS